MFFNPLTILAPKSLSFSKSHSAALLMPFQIPCTRFLPISSIFSGNPEKKPTIEDITPGITSPALLIKLAAQSPSLPTAWDKNSHIFPGSSAKNVTAASSAAGSVSVKNITIASHTFAHASAIKFHALISAFLKSSFVFHK